MPHARTLLAACALVVSGGCSDSTSPLTCDPDAPGPSLEGQRRDLLPPPPSVRTVNEVWADIAREVPGGWGGFFFVNGQPTIYLVDPSQRAQAVAALYDHGVGVPYDLHDTDVWRGRWDFAQLYDWYTYIFVVVGWPIGLVSTDIDEFRNRLTYGVLDAQAAAFLSSLFTEAALPCELTIIEVTGPVILD